MTNEICSFLDKYYTVQKDIKNTIKINLENREKLDCSIDKIIDLPTNISNKSENDKYNKIVKQNNILINLAKQKYEKFSKDDKDEKYKERFMYFKPLKNFPSFPLVEKQHEISYSDLNDLLNVHIENAINWWNTITNEQMQNAMAHFHDRIIYKLFKYHYNIDDTIPNNYKLNSWEQKYVNNKSPIEIILEKIDKKIENIQKYLNNQKNNNFTDNRNQKELTK